MKQKKCLYCKREFSPKDNRQKYCCKNCSNKKWNKDNYNYRREWNDEWYIKNKEKIKLLYEKNKEQTKKHYEENRDIYKDRSLKQHYNLSLIEYNNLLKKQNNKCAICGVKANKLKYKLSVDHCHKTRNIRELLCQNCNRILGILEGLNKNIILKQRFICYLKKWNLKNKSKRKTR